MKIGLFAPYDLARPGGVASHVRAQARALRTLGHTVIVYGPASGPLPAGEVAIGRAIRLTVGGTTSGVGLDPRTVRSVVRTFGRERFDIVHVHEPLMPLLPWCAVWSARAPIVGTFHVYREDGHALYPVARPLLRRLVQRLDARVAVSEAARRTVARHFPGDYEIIPNGVEFERFQTKRARPAAMRAAGRTVLCVGRLEPRKGAATLIEAMRDVQSRVPDASLVMVGDGPDASGLAGLARRTGTRVTFVRDVGDDDLPAYYQAADVVCAPALGGESFGIVLLEALAAGRPVVASRIDGYAATVGESSCVRLVPPGDRPALSEALVGMLEEPPASAAEAQQIASGYDWRSVAERLLTVYQRLVRPSPR